MVHCDLVQGIVFSSGLISGSDMSADSLYYQPSLGSLPGFHAIGSLLGYTGNHLGSAISLKLAPWVTISLYDIKPCSISSIRLMWQRQQLAQIMEVLRHNKHNHCWGWIRWLWHQAFAFRSEGRLNYSYAPPVGMITIAMLQALRPCS